MNIASENTDDFVKKAVQIASLEKPSNEFIPSLMSKIEELNKDDSKLSVTSPIISWKGWVTIGIIIISVFTLLLLFDSSTLSFSVLQQYVDRIAIQPITIPVSGTFLTGVTAFVFFFIVQIYLSVNRLNKRENI